MKDCTKETLPPELNAVIVLRSQDRPPLPREADKSRVKSSQRLIDAGAVMATVGRTEVVGELVVIEPPVETGH